LAIYKEQDFSERRNAANEARKALLERFKSRPAEDDPEVQARKAERQAILEAREKRNAEKEKLKQERLAREAIEKAEREAKIREAEETDRITRLLADEAERKAKRDARYAARKARGGRMPLPPRP
jgi:hypothetical protein